jgi:hypothetical protein
MAPENRTKPTPVNVEEARVLLVPVVYDIPKGSDL